VRLGNLPYIDTLLGTMCQAIIPTAQVLSSPEQNKPTKAGGWGHTQPLLCFLGQSV
jgi:hypothetical protein